MDLRASMRFRPLSNGWSRVKLRNGWWRRTSLPETRPTGHGLYAPTRQWHGTRVAAARMTRETSPAREGNNNLQFMPDLRAVRLLVRYSRDSATGDEHQFVRQSDNSRHHHRCILISGSLCMRCSSHAEPHGAVVCPGLPDRRLDAVEHGGRAVREPRTVSPRRDPCIRNRRNRVRRTSGTHGFHRLRPSALPKSAAANAACFRDVPRHSPAFATVCWE